MTFSNVNGVTVTPLHEGCSYEFNGTATADGQMGIYGSRTKMPEGVKPGGQYRIHTLTEITRGLALNITVSREGGAGATLAQYIFRKEECDFNIYIPSDAVGINIFFSIAANVEFDHKKIRLWLSEVTRRSSAKDMAVLRANTLSREYGLFAYCGQMNAALEIVDNRLSHLCIPAEGARTVTVQANKRQPNAVALLRELPDRVNPIKFCWLRDEEGNIVRDEHGDPVEDRRRYVITKSNSRTLMIPEECRYLYMHAGDATSPTTFLPGYLKIDNKEFEVSEKETPTAMTTVFFDDFDREELGKNWKGLRNKPNAMPHYGTLFYTDDDDCYLSDSCLVLRTCRDPEKDLGYQYDYDMKTGKPKQNERGDYIMVPRKWKGPYISTQDAFAVRKGSISAKIKFSNHFERHFCFTFFTFSQNAEWPYAPEFDIIEGYSQLLETEITTRRGDVFPAGTIYDTLASHVHYQGAERKSQIDGFIRNSFDGNIYWQAQDLAGFDETEWHVYKITWDEHHLICYVDNYVLCRIDLDNMPNDTIWTSPADIRFNIRRRTWCDMDESACAYIDWVRVETAEGPQPPTGITYEDKTLRVGESLYVKPTFAPENASNCAYDMTTDDTGVVSLYNYHEAYECVYHRIDAIAPGTATVKIKTANGRCEHTFRVTVT